MKGTEKQIAWANDIINGARSRIKSGLENALAPADNREAWQIVSEKYEACIARCDDAAKIIDRRYSLNADAVEDAMKGVLLQIWNRKQAK